MRHDMVSDPHARLAVPSLNDGTPNDGAWS